MTTPASSGHLPALLGSVYEAVTGAVTGLEPGRFLTRTRADAWSVQDLLFHLMLDAQRALLAFASPSDDTPDVDSVSYWRDFRPDRGDGGAAHARFVRVASSAYPGPDVLVEHWRETSRAAVRAAAWCPHERVTTQGHTLALPDFLETLVVEAAVHHLDLTGHLTAAPPPGDALGVVRKTLDGLLGIPAPTGWDDTEYALKGTGRLPLTEPDREALGDLAGAFPLLG